MTLRWDWPAMSIPISEKTARFFTPDRSGRDLLFTPDFTASELKGRRQRIADAIGADARLLIAGAPPTPTDHPYQDASFYYFTGLETCGAYLLVDGGTGRSRLFLPSRDTMDGEPHNRLGFEDAALIRDRLDMDEVASTDALTAALSGSRVVYLPQGEVEGGGATLFRANINAKRCAEEAWDQAEPRHQRLMRLLKQRIPGVEVRDALPLIREMRTIKSPAEIAVLRQAGALAANAVVEAMKATRPGITENHLQAVGEFVYRDRGHCGPAYGWIVAGGNRTWDGHYHFNNATLHDSHIVLMDCGPDLRHYTSDIARIWPVNGTFDAWHRRVYGFIVEYHKALLSLVRPGVLPGDVYREADRRMASLCNEPDSSYHDMRPLFQQMVARGVGYLNHGVGLSVHDAIGQWKDVPLREGFVCVCDPMVWCEPQREYLRVEDTIVVTADGCERLTGAAPIEIAEIEALLR
jgi:Xaa-Pro aminopeptidase